MLAESEEPLPPILVHRATGRVIDGMHRLGAAQLRGQQTIDVRYFDGTAEEAFVVAVRSNVSHGLPLSLADREAAAARIIVSHPHWSDRSIAAATGLATRNVAAIRRSTGEAAAQAVRIGRDGRARPVDSADGRRLASRLIADHPEASLREVARAAGISPTTARDVRQRMDRGDDPVPTKRRGGKAQDTEGPASGARTGGQRFVLKDPAAVLQNLTKDPSLRFTESGRALLRWLLKRAIGPEEWQEMAAATPLHCAYVVAALAREHAAGWLEFAKVLEGRVEVETSNPGAA
jgi:ParB-like chromosome segregation protein Spo0J